MRRVVVLGAGFAGLTLATELDPLARAGKVNVTLLERSPAFSAGFSMQWAMVGRRALEDGLRPYTSLTAKAVNLVQDEVVSIDAGAKAVLTRSRRFPYDDLVIALGAELAPDLVPGLPEAAYNLCDANSVMQLRGALLDIQSGDIIVAVAAVPFKCPPAPYEYALLIDDMMRTRGVRDSVRIKVTTPEAQPMPVAGKTVGDAVLSMLAERGIDFLPGHKPRAVDTTTREVAYENGASLRYDILAAMPPHRAPHVVREAGLTDVSGFVPAELGTFRTPAADVFAVGDVAGLRLPNGNPHPKAGVFAEAQARTVARNIAAGVTGGKPAEYLGTGACYVDIGQGQAAAAEAELLRPDGPRIVLSPPSAEALDDKLQFERERLRRWFGR